MRNVFCHQPAIIEQTFVWASLVHYIKTRLPLPQEGNPMEIRGTFVCYSTMSPESDTEDVLS